MGLFDRFKNQGKSDSGYAKKFKEAYEKYEKNETQANIDSLFSIVNSWKEYEHGEENGEMEDANIWYAHAISYGILARKNFDHYPSAMVSFNKAVTKKPKDASLLDWYRNRSDKIISAL